MQLKSRTMTGFARAGVVAGALLLAGCNQSLEDITPKAEKGLPAELLQQMRAQGMSAKSPIMIRIFKEESVLEVWKQKDNGRFGLAASYDICKWSGKLGPKFTEGDRQAPEGFYTVNPYQMNPRSSYHLSFNIGFPNSYDRAHGRTGQHLMVHGACSSAGCYSMTDEQVEQIYAFAREAFEGGQGAFQIQAFPFRMTAENMARYQEDPNYQFWTMLKEGYDHFEITKAPPKVDVCEGRYVFNQMPADGRGFSASAACPPMSQPETLRTAYLAYQADYAKAFAAALDKPKKVATPAPTITNQKEAALVAEWSRRRARGEEVTRQPPSLANPEILIVEQKRKAQELTQTVAEVPSARPASEEAQQAVAEASATDPATGANAAEAVMQASAGAEPPMPNGEQPSLRKRLTSRLLGMFAD